MKFFIKTPDDFWVGVGGEFITKNITERAIFDTKKLAQWYIDNTNVFGKLKIVKARKRGKRIKLQQAT